MEDGNGLREFARQSNLSKIAKCRMCRQSLNSCSPEKTVLHSFKGKSTSQSLAQWIDLKKILMERTEEWVEVQVGKRWEGTKRGKAFSMEDARPFRSRLKRSLATEKPVYIEGRQRSVIDRAIDIFQGQLKLKAPASSGFSRVE